MEQHVQKQTVTGIRHTSILMSVNCTSSVGVRTCSSVDRSDNVCSTLVSSKVAAGQYNDDLAFTV